ncbi:hypothetical protein ACFY8B_32825 [Streptomyces sp. NPDC012751]|uniref:hypothetical protein n=1 Tax=Streptomyces sp. NPDC012751 TaxID=3364846 RepID=UPI00369C1C4B
MPSDLIQRMQGCGDCRTLAVEYGTTLISSRRPRAKDRDWELPLVRTRVELEDHLAVEHAVWLPDRVPGCGICEDWRSEPTDGPLEEAEALHRAWHLCEPLRDICTPGDHGITDLM